MSASGTLVALAVSPGVHRRLSAAVMHDHSKFRRNVRFARCARINRFVCHGAVLAHWSESDLINVYCRINRMATRNFSFTILEHLSAMADALHRRRRPRGTARRVGSVSGWGAGAARGRQCQNVAQRLVLAVTSRRNSRTDSPPKPPFRRNSNPRCAARSRDRVLAGSIMHTIGRGP